jgi:hypothetical protein
VEVNNDFNNIRPSVPFDVTQHRFWRFRDDGSTIHFEVSGDGASFTEMTTYPSANVRLDVAVLNLGAYGDVDAVGHFTVGSATATGMTPSCPASSYSNDFQDGMPDLEFSWGYRDGTCDFQEVDGVLRFFAPSTCQDEGTSAGSLAAFDLSDSSASIEVVTPNSDVFAWFRLGDDRANNVYAWHINHGTAEAAYAVDDQEYVPVTLPYDHSAMRFLRIREEGGVVYWDTSADGAAWQARAQADVFFDISTLRITTGVYANSTHSVDSTVEFDNLNITL